MAKFKLNLKTWHIALIIVALLIIAAKGNDLLGRQAPVYGCSISCTNQINQVSTNAEKLSCEQTGKTCSMTQCSGTNYWQLSCSGSGTTCGTRYEGEICTSTSQCRCTNPEGQTLHCLNSVCTPDAIGDGSCGLSEDCHNAPVDCACPSGKVCKQGISLWYCDTTTPPPSSGGYCACKFLGTNTCTGVGLDNNNVCSTGCAHGNTQQEAIDNCNDANSGFEPPTNNCFCIENNDCVRKFGTDCVYGCEFFGPTLPAYDEKTGYARCINNNDALDKINAIGCYKYSEALGACSDYGASECNVEGYVFKYYSASGKPTALASCQASVAPIVCGDKKCMAGEDLSCPNDCYTKGICGDGVCNSANGESEFVCPQDCKAGPLNWWDQVRASIYDTLLKAGVPAALIPILMWGVVLIGGLFAFMFLMNMLQMLMQSMQPPRY